MIEATIYALGAALILIVEVTVILALTWFIAARIVSGLYKELYSGYKYAQLSCLMKKLVKKGYRETLKQSIEEDWRIIEKEGD